jgi:hypothetical protein
MESSPEREEMRREKSKGVRGGCCLWGRKGRLGWSCMKRSHSVLLVQELVCCLPSEEEER